MFQTSDSRYFSIILVISLMVAGGLGFIFGAQDTNPISVIRHYPLDILSFEASTMVECVECHEAQEFHTCQTCHDDHGAIELTEVPFYNWILFSGDVPKPDFVEINQILPYREHPNTMISVLDFLKSQGVEDFEQVGLYSDDGGVVLIEKSELPQQAYLMPYKDGIRFACEDLHVSTWIKGIRKIIVIGSEKPLVIDGEHTSLGRLMLGQTTKVTVEATNVMLVSETDGKTRKAVTASQFEGIALADVMNFDPGQPLIVVDQSGTLHQIAAEDALSGILVPIRGVLTLVLPERGRSFWIENVVKVEKIDP
ncbi:MAG TPA: hypothetical protein VLM80_08200 [Anaerolineales bacterium]|nr:hypothetical protein [Anaerolineales bacterium]